MIKWSFCCCNSGPMPAVTFGGSTTMIRTLLHSQPCHAMGMMSAPFCGLCHILRVNLKMWYKPLLMRFRGTLCSDKPMGRFEGLTNKCKEMRWISMDNLYTLFASPVLFRFRSSGTRRLAKKKASANTKALED